MSENKLAVLRWLVTGEAGLVQRLAPGFAIRKVSKAPAARRGVLFRVFDHDLHIHAGPDNEGLSPREHTGQRFVVVFRRDASPMQRNNNRAVGLTAETGKVDIRTQVTGLRTNQRRLYW